MNVESVTRQEERLTVHSGPDWIARLVDQDTGVVIELENRPIRPLCLLCNPNNHGVPDISSTDLVRDTTARCAFGAEVSLFLNHHDDPVTCNDHKQNTLKQSRYITEAKYVGEHPPTVAARFLFNTFSHSTTAAPELSMQFSILYKPVVPLARLIPPFPCLSVFTHLYLNHLACILEWTKC